MEQQKVIDEQLKTCIADKLSVLNISEPYVWRLHLSVDDYYTLDGLISESIRAHGGKQDHLFTREFALITIVYLAEWYKRIYCGAENGSTDIAIKASTPELKQLWDASGINIDKFVYKTENGTRLWQYSIYVLGGLAIRHELARNDKGKFLKALCRVYHGEEYTLENLDEANRAVSFRQSILQKHSLYEYLREILNGEYSDDDEQIQQLLHYIKSANDEILKSKFRLEWVVNNPSDNSTMKRRLRVWLKPEEVGGTLHQYLRFDRIHIWGIAKPEELKYLFFGIRWYQGDMVIRDFDKKKPLITYMNTGSENGFVSWGVEKYATLHDVPTAMFTRFEILAFDQNNNEYVAQEEKATDFMQLWRIDSWSDDWSSKSSNQHQTAVVYSNHWTADVESDAKKPFCNKVFEKSADWNWNYIYSSITLRNAKGEEYTLYNRIGYDQVYADLYKNTIRYQDGGLVSYFEYDEEEGNIEERYPLIFKKQDIRIRHFATKDAILDAETEEDIVAEQVEFKGESGKYSVWNNTEEPECGVLNLRVTVKGVYHKMTVVYLHGPVIRDFDNTRILYKDMEDIPQCYQDHIPMDKQPLEPTIEIEIGAVKLQVYRPTEIKELYWKDSMLGYGNEQTSLPYILKEDFKIADFSKNGFRVYTCKELGPIYPLTGTNDNSVLDCWDRGKTWQATELDANAPEWLKVKLGDMDLTDKRNLTFYYWNIYKEDAPSPVAYNEIEKVGKGDIIFQDMSQTDEQLLNITPRIGKPDPFGGKKVKMIELKCYDIARQYNLHFFVFKPLRDVVARKEWMPKLVEPLLKRGAGKLSKEDKKLLLRFADEMELKPSDLNLDIDN